jgi:peptide/nickel transport system permease protein
LDPVTFQPLWSDDTSQKYYIHFFIRSWEYNLLGVIPTDIHLFGVEDGGTIHLMGTDRFGRDLWGRSAMAGRISLTLSVLAALVAVVIGSSVGVISGYYGGTIDNLLQRFVEIVLSLPELPLWMALAAIIPRQWSSLQVFLVMCLIFPLLRWAVLAREVRGKVISLRETDFIMAAKEQGASDMRIIFRHLYPNALSHVIVILTLLIPDIILAEAFLSFLGIGIQEPLTSWGYLMKNAQNLETLGQNTWIMTPVFFIIVAVLGLNFLGDGLRDAADPYSNL